MTPRASWKLIIFLWTWFYLCPYYSGGIGWRSKELQVFNSSRLLIKTKSDHDPQHFLEENGNCKSHFVAVINYTWTLYIPCTPFSLLLASNDIKTWLCAETLQDRVWKLVISKLISHEMHNKVIQTKSVQKNKLPKWHLLVSDSAFKTLPLA